METTVDGPSTTPEGQSDHRSTEISKKNGENRCASSTGSEEERPPLPPRPETIDLLNEDNGSWPPNARPHLQSQATTALSLKDIPRQTHSDTVESFIPGFGRSLLGRGLKARNSLSQLNSARGSEAGDTASIRSFVANSEEGPEESVFGDFTAEPVHHLNARGTDVLGLSEFPQDDGGDSFVGEFDDIGDLDEGGDNEGLSSIKDVLSKIY